MVTAAPAAPTGIGVFEGLDYEQYHKIDAFRRSVLMQGTDEKGTMAHVKAAKDDVDSEESEALLFGNVLHAAILEPDRFERDVILGPGRDVTDKETGVTEYKYYGTDTQKYAKFKAENPGKNILAKGDRERVVGMGKSIREDADALTLLRSCTQTELTLVWEDAETGVRCKARLDAGASPSSGIVDLKSAELATDWKFSKSLYDFGYHIQAAMALDGWEALTGESELPFTIIVVEKKFPYLVRVLPVGWESIQIGRAEYRKVLRGVSQCLKTGKWPGYPSGPQTINVPEYVIKRYFNT